MAREAAWLTADKQAARRSAAAIASTGLQQAADRFRPTGPAQSGCFARTCLPAAFRCWPTARSRIPQLSYANAAALQLWDSHWDGLIGMPSRLTAPDSERAERSSALGQAKRLDAVQNYRGIRISRKGRRFMINKARIWTLWDAEERVCGQAACFSDWWWL